MSGLPADQVNELLLKRVCHLKEKDRSEIIQRLEVRRLDMDIYVPVTFRLGRFGRLW